MGRGEKEKREGKEEERRGEEGEKNAIERLPAFRVPPSPRACAGRACAPKHAPRFGAGSSEAKPRRSRGAASLRPAVPNRHFRRGHKMKEHTLGYLLSKA